MDKNAGKFKSGRWTVDKDTSNHGGNRAWELKHGDDRVGTLDENGKVVAD